MYDSQKQYTCIIIRGRLIHKMDDLLPMYAAFIDRVCPCPKEEFIEGFNNEFRAYAIANAKKKIDGPSIDKTLANSRTEISGKLFGMHFEDDGFVYATERTKKFLQDNDQPAFFKDWLIKMQFPNGMSTSNTYLQMVHDGVNCSPYPILLKVMELLGNEHIILNKTEIGYYILNSEDVMKGNAFPEEICAAIKQDRNLGIKRKLEIPQGKSSSYYQHITEQLHYLQFANLVILDHKDVYLNRHEKKAIDKFTALCNKPLGFDAYKYDLSTIDGRKVFERDWCLYYGKLSSYDDALITPINALVQSEFENISGQPHKTPGTNKIELGDDGEAYVYEFERNRVAAYNTRLANKVLSLGKTKGLGYDIQSVVAEGSAIEAEYARYIEVKATKRVTAPEIEDDTWIDTVNITRNEWVAAQQFHEFYSIYRVYFTRDGVTIYVLKNPYQKSESGKVSVVPMTYRMDFQKDAIDEILREGDEDV